MALRNRTMAKGHLQNPRRYFLQQIPSPADTKTKTSYYKATAIFSICSLMVSSVLISPAEKNIQTTAPTKDSPMKSPSFSGFLSRIPTKSPDSA